VSHWAVSVKAWRETRIRHIKVALYRIDLGGVGVVSISFENNRKIAKNGFRLRAKI
jgi:hypothetical protein